MGRINRYVFLVALGWVVADSAALRSAQGAGADLTTLGLEDLLNLNVTVTSATRKPQELASVAASVAVVTSADIRRSGATTLPDALRLVPGLQVARVDSTRFAVSARGFNGIISNKLLVLVDGRAVYTPLFSGTAWQLQDLMLEDVDRIEVIRGPGAAMWGSNAVHGVINVITKPAAQTQGTLVSVGGGTEERVLAAVRQGVSLGENQHLRAYARYRQSAGGPLQTSGDRLGLAETRTAGFRADLATGEADRLTLSGGLTLVDNPAQILAYQPTPPYLFQPISRTGMGGAHVLGRWSRELSADSSVAVQGSFTREYMTRADFSVATHVADLDVQHQARLSPRHDLIWGGSLRYYADSVEPTFTYVGVPRKGEMAQVGLFAQDEITLAPKELSALVGVRVEHSTITDLVVQPNLRLAWTPDPSQTVWTAVSRAVRTPARGERDIRQVRAYAPGPGGLPLFVEFTGNPDVKPESVIAYEAGYRVRLRDDLSVDLSAFYNTFDQLRSTEVGPPSLATSGLRRFVAPAMVANQLRGSSRGVELTTEWQPVAGLRLRAAYAHLLVDLRTRGGDPSAPFFFEGVSPQHQAWIDSSVELAPDLDFDLRFRYVGPLKTNAINGYSTLDLRLGWRPDPMVELAIVGQNLLSSSRLEFVAEQTPAVSARVPRGVYATATFRF